MTIFRLSTDMGGTFTDLIVNGEYLYKSSTVPEDPIRGILNVIDVAAKDIGIGRRALLENTVQFVHGTTRATNAILNNDVARTALFVTRGHPDILLWREGGRVGTFDFSYPYPAPYIPRRLTFEVPERIGPQGEIVEHLHIGKAKELIAAAKAANVQAIAVCFLWSIVNPEHEKLFGELVREALPGVPFTLSHELNPSIREYRRASSAAIDASLKPLMSEYLNALNSRLAKEGLRREVLVVTSAGAILPASAVAEKPIHTLASGPALAPVAGRRIASHATDTGMAIVTDAGGTSFDVSLVRNGEIPWTRETRIGRSFLGPITGFPSVDVKSIGAGGGSIAWVDEGGLLHVGPQSAGASPGPACYGRGGTRPTVTDACLVLGYLDPGFFLGGAIELDLDASRKAVREQVSTVLGLTLEEGAAAILTVATEQMVNAIEDIAISQGVDPRNAPIVIGGGSGGFYGSAIVKRLKAQKAVVHHGSAALSALGGLIGDVMSEFAETLPTTTARFAMAEVNALLDRLERQATDFLERVDHLSESTEITFLVEARYPQQVWDLEVTLPSRRFSNQEDVEALRQAFHRAHRAVLSVDDPDSTVEAITWRVRARAKMPAIDIDRRAAVATADGKVNRRPMYFPGTGPVEGEVHRVDAMPVDRAVAGPAVLESPATTIVVVPGMIATKLASGAITIAPTA